jgi:hypothetical protein
VNSSGFSCKEPFKRQGMRGLTLKPHQQNSQPKTRKITREIIFMRMKTIQQQFTANPLGTVQVI